MAPSKKRRILKAVVFCGLFCVLGYLLCFKAALPASAKTKIKPCDVPVVQIEKVVLSKKKITARRLATAIDAASPDVVIEKQGASKTKDYRYLAKGARLLKKTHNHVKIKIISRKKCSKKRVRKLQKHYKDVLTIEQAKRITMSADGGKLTVTVIKVDGKWYLDRADALHQVKKANKVLKHFNFDGV